MRWLDGQGCSFRSIVHINEKGGAFGGTEEYIEGLTHALASKGVRSHLVCGLVAGPLPPASPRLTYFRRLQSSQWVRRLPIQPGLFTARVGMRAA